MATDHGPTIKDDRRYAALRRHGMSKRKAARIANTPAAVAGRRGGRAPTYEQWSREALYDKAKQLGIRGRSTMRKRDLIHALRHS